ATTHAPHLFRVGLEKYPKQPLAELIADPVFEGLRVGNGEGLSLQEGDHARTGLKHAQLRQRLKRFQGVTEELIAVINAGGAGPLKHEIAADLGPQVFDLLGFRKKPVAADVEVESLVVNGARDSTNVFGVRLQDNDGLALL